MTLNHFLTRYNLAVVTYTNQYKHLVTQREFSGFEARQRVKGIVELGLSSLMLIKVTASESLKLAILERFWLPTSALISFIREPPLLQLFALN